MSSIVLIVLLSNVLVPPVDAGESTTEEPTTTTTTTATTTTEVPPCCDCTNYTTDPWFTGGPCGQSKVSGAGSIPLAPRIIGGQDADPNEYPWMVMIGDGECGGSILNRYWVLTAAQCVNCTGDTGVTVRAGKHNYDYSSTEPTEQVRSSMRIECCPPIPSIHDDDIALIRVSEPFAINEDVAPICPPTWPLLSGGETVVFTGWGDIDNAGANPDFLQETSELVLDHQTCGDHWDVTECQLCITDGVDDTIRNACDGDSGDPVIIGSDTVDFQQVGIVSLYTRSPNCASGKPVVATRVACYLRWINDVMSAADRN